VAIALAFVAVLIAWIGALFPPFLALNPRLGLFAYYHMRLIRRVLNLSGLALAVTAAILSPTWVIIVALALVVIFFGISLRLEPTAVLTGLDTPGHVAASDAPLGDEALVFGYQGQTMPCAWPLEVLIPRHIINDELEDKPLLVGY